MLLFFWRRHPDLNRGSGICSPVPYHLAMAPYMGFADGSVRKSFFVERLTRLELATSTLARWRSTG